MIFLRKSFCSEIPIIVVYPFTRRRYSCLMVVPDLVKCGNYEGTEAMLDDLPNGVQDRFNAAVTVIRTLPANGSFQPSREMLLRFYALYKQATEGPCQSPRPPFYDVTNRAKWEAYAAVHDMAREAAMEEYVGELKKIVEMMSLTPEVSQFLDKLGSFYELVTEESGGPSAKQKIDTLRPMIIAHSIVQDIQMNGSKTSAEEVPLATHVVDVMEKNCSVEGTVSDDDNDGDLFLDAFSQSGSECRRNSADCTANLVHARLNNSKDSSRNPADLSIFEALFPQLENLRRRTCNLERRVVEHDHKLAAMQTRIDRMSTDRTYRICKGSHEASQDYVGNRIQNRIVPRDFTLTRPAYHPLIHLREEALAHLNYPPQ